LWFIIDLRLDDRCRRCSSHLLLSMHYSTIYRVLQDDIPFYKCRHHIPSHRHR